MIGMILRGGGSFSSLLVLLVFAGALLMVPLVIIALRRFEEQFSRRKYEQRTGTPERAPVQLR